jgi:Ca-activated chloride channel family protein
MPMKFLLSFLILPFFLASVIPQDDFARLTQTSQYRYDIKVEMVGLFATVLDRSGRLVTDLTCNDFVLYDQGKPQVITQFSYEYLPLSVVILLDTSSSMDGEKLEDARKSLVQFLKRLKRGDEAMLIEFRGRPRVTQPFTEKFSLIERDLRQLEGAGSTALYDAVLMALDQIQSAHNRRRTILLISDGINTYGRAHLDDTVSGLRKHGVELFAIGLESGVPEELRGILSTRRILDKLTQSAGGESFIISDSKDLRRISGIISDQMHNQYSFGYYPPKTSEGEWRNIRLETRTQGFRVVPSRAGYYASSND